MDINTCTCNANDQMPGKWHDKDCPNKIQVKIPKPKRIRKPRPKRVIM